MPVLRSLLICDEVTSEKGQFNVLGVKGVFVSQTFPAKARFNVFALIDELPPGPAAISLRFEETDSIKLGEYRQQVSIHPEFDGRLWHVFQVFATIVGPGQYVLAYDVNGEELGRYPFAVEEALEWD